jgi:hypothetical protein
VKGLLPNKEFDKKAIKGLKGRQFISPGRSPGLMNKITF